MEETRRKKSRNRYAFMALMVIIGFGLYYYYSQERGSEKPPELTVLMNDQVRREAVLGSYEWKSGRRIILADADHPANFTYQESSTLEASDGQRIYLSALSDDSRSIPANVLSIQVFERGNPLKMADADYQVNGETIVLNIREASGDYVYLVHMEYGDKGNAQYGIHVLVDDASYPVEDLKKMRIPYVGNHGMVGEILSKLPRPGSGYAQRYLALKTQAEPYGIICYYEPVEEMAGSLMMPEETSENAVYLNMEKNALVLFSLIGNVEHVTFKVRNTPSPGELKDFEYQGAATFSRQDLAEKYGDLENILDDQELFKNRG